MICENVFLLVLMFDQNLLRPPLKDPGDKFVCYYRREPSVRMERTNIHVTLSLVEYDTLCRYSPLLRTKDDYQTPFLFNDGELMVRFQVIGKLR